MAPAPETTFTGPELCRLTARQAIAALKAGDVTPAELIEASLTRIAQTSPAINAMVATCAERAHEAAKTADPSSLLAGLPIGIKDLTPVKGVRTTWGTPALADFIPDASDPLVLRLESRGGVVIGKTNTPEMGAGANTFNPVYGPTLNPWNTAMNAGGSSGGAAVGLATGETWLSHGSDLGGSLRTPASFCGIVGLRPSPGVALGGGPDSFDPMPVQGPMARNVADCALFLDAMAGYDPVSALSYPAPAQSYLDACLAPSGAIRIGFSADLGGLAPVTPEMERILRAGLAALSGEGVTLQDCRPPLKGADTCFRTLRALGFWAQARKTPDRITRQYKPTLQQNIADGRALTTEDVAEAITTRTRIYHDMRGFLSGFDVLACPVSGLPPLPQSVEYPTEVAGVPCRDYLDWLVFAYPATLCGLPALSLPLGFTDTGLPVGIQLIGQPRGEARLLQVARVLEERIGFAQRPIDPIPG
ncbi:amidase [Tropicibacter oceani]|uniref:Amidase n=1 Tax=Tropicibacter oceani TaxID=3058420 RepID=A0ABY8QLK1_9RHOB|nr:amidase [Tropicibacter oceani]WGW04866.1 amidase [Tropicibacter oceani]